MPKHRVDADLFGNRGCRCCTESDISNPRFGSQAASLPAGLCPGRFAEISTTQPATRNRHNISGNRFISLNARGTQLDVVYGEDPEVFRPERWLTTDEERLKAMHQTVESVFGYGCTKGLGMLMALVEFNKMIFEVGFGDSTFESLSS